MNQGARQLSIAVQADKTEAAYARLGAMAEGLGFGGVSVYGDLGFQPPLFPLLAMAAHTTRVRLGAACLNPYLVHPIELTGQVAALDQASGGRAYLGLARGSWLDQVGIAPDRPLRRLREAVEVVRLLLRGDPGGYTGQVFRIEPGTTLHWPPLRPRVDVMIGAWGPKTLALAGELADEVKVGGSANPDLVAPVRASLVAGARRSGRPPDAVGVAFGAVTVVDEDRAVARRLARTQVAMYLAVVADLDPTADVPVGLLERVRTAVAAGDHEGAGAQVSDQVLDRFALAGTPDDVAGQVGALFDAGVTRVEFGTPHGVTPESGVELLGRRVLPAVLS